MTRTVPAVPTTVTAYPDGPLVVRGPAVFVGEDGREIERRDGPVALCRCGRSETGPFCDGTHKGLQRAALRRARRREGLDGPQAGTSKARPRPEEPDSSTQSATR